MKVILNMSVSPNGIAARENDSTDFLTHGEWELLVALAHEMGTLVWGRRTHELVRGYGGALAAFDGLVRVVLSHDPQLGLEPGWRVATSPQHALDLLAEAGQIGALVAGGATTNAAFARAGLIDEIILFVGSVILGRGVPVFAPQDFELQLNLLETKRVRDEVARLHYRVLVDRA